MHSLNRNQPKRCSFSSSFQVCMIMSDQKLASPSFEPMKVLCFVIILVCFPVLKVNSLDLEISAKLD